MANGGRLEKLIVLLQALAFFRYSLLGVRAVFPKYIVTILTSPYG